MNYILVFSTHSEIEARLVEGRLRNEGLLVKSDYTHQFAGKTMKPSLFGLYVPEADVSKAKSLLVSH